MVALIFCTLFYIAGKGVRKLAEREMPAHFRRDDSGNSRIIVAPREAKFGAMARPALMSLYNETPHQLAQARL